MMRKKQKHMQIVKDLLKRVLVYMPNQNQKSNKQNKSSHKIRKENEKNKTKISAFLHKYGTGQPLPEIS